MDWQAGVPKSNMDNILKKATSKEQVRALYRDPLQLIHNTMEPALVQKRSVC